jgi:hypothetical protein
MKKIKIEDYYSIVFEESNELKDKVYESVLNWFIKHKSFHGETIMQNDDTLINAPDFLSDVCDDMFKFKIEYND